MCDKIRKLVFRLRIDPVPGGQILPQKSFEVLDVLFWGLKASPVAWTG
jgi:hypothetical protein